MYQAIGTRSPQSQYNAIVIPQTFSSRRFQSILHTVRVTIIGDRYAVASVPIQCDSDPANVQFQAIPINPTYSAGTRSPQSQYNAIVIPQTFSSRRFQSILHTVRVTIIGDRYAVASVPIQCDSDPAHLSARPGFLRLEVNISINAAPLFSLSRRSACARTLALGSLTPAQ
ncbi:hypothetical protein J6590_034813 [Homalodisca vitripennis]|nr:hypothetical protein J6590_034813 [Homalodisca vitripennis]